MRRAAAVLGIAAAWNAGGHWPQFRGPAGSGVAPGSPPVTWDGPAGRNILWKTEIPGLGHSSPVIWGDRIFVTSAVPASGEAALKLGLYGDIQPVEAEGPHEFRVYCLDRQSGRILWQRTAARGIPKTKRHPKSTHANPTPATDGKRLIVSFGSEGLYAYDVDGNLLWKKDFGVLDAGFFRAPQAQWGFASSPILHDGMVIVQADVQQNSFLAAFNAASGAQIWRVARADVPAFSTPAVVPYAARTSRGQARFVRGGAGGQGPGAGASSAGESPAGRQVVVNGWKHIGGYDLETGKELWRLTGGGDIPVPTPVYSDGLIIITNAHGPMRPIYAIRADAAGDITGDRTAIAWFQERAGNYMQTPLLHQGLAYFCFDNGVLTVYRLAGGERLYQQRLGGGTTGFTSSPVAAGGRIYITSEEGQTFVLAAGSAYRLLGTNELGESVMATAAIAGDVLYVRGRRHLFAIGGQR